MITFLYFFDYSRFESSKGTQRRVLVPVHQIQTRCAMGASVPFRFSSVDIDITDIDLTQFDIVECEYSATSDEDEDRGTNDLVNVMEGHTDESTAVEIVCLIFKIELPPGGGG